MGSKRHGKPGKRFRGRPKLLHMFLWVLVAASMVLTMWNFVGSRHNDAQSDTADADTRSQFMHRQISKYFPAILNSANTARQANEFGDYAAVQMIHKDSIVMTKHWICSLRRADASAVLGATLFVALDPQSERALIELDKNLRVVLLSFLLGKQAQYEKSRMQDFELSQIRANLVAKLLLEGVNVMILESGAYWGRNALQDIQELGWEENTYDALGAADYSPSAGAVHVGFQLIQATENSKMLWVRMVEQINLAVATLHQGGSAYVLPPPDQTLDDVVFQSLLWKFGKSVEYKLKYLPTKIVASGRWYSDSEWASQVHDPAVILNTKVSGSRLKVQRAISRGHFAYDETTNKCVHPDLLRQRTFQATIVILTMARAHSLERLLKSLKAADYDAGPGKSNDIRFLIRIDKPNQEKYAQGYAQVLSMADEFQHDAFIGGVSVDIQTTNKGLKNQWFTSFQNPRSDREVGIFLEDDLEVSPHYFKWLRIQWENHGDNPYVGSVSLQRQTLRAALPPNFNSPIMNHHRPFLYRLIGTWGLSARADLWLDFTKSYIDRTDVDIPGLITTKWYRDPVAGKSMWSQHFIHYLWKKDKFTLFVNLPNGKTMCSNWQEPGEHYHGKPKVDFPALQVWNERVMTAHDAELKRHDFNTDLISD